MLSIIWSLLFIHSLGNFETNGLPGTSYFDGSDGGGGNGIKESSSEYSYYTTQNSDSLLETNPTSYSNSFGPNEIMGDSSNSQNEINSYSYSYDSSPKSDSLSGYVETNPTSYSYFSGPNESNRIPLPNTTSSFQNSVSNFGSGNTPTSLNNQQSNSYSVPPNPQVNHISDNEQPTNSYFFFINEPSMTENSYSENTSMVQLRETLQWILGYGSSAYTSGMEYFGVTDYQADFRSIIFYISENTSLTDQQKFAYVQQLASFSPQQVQIISDVLNSIENNVLFSSLQGVQMSDIEKARSYLAQAQQMMFNIQQNYFSAEYSQQMQEIMSEVQRNVNAAASYLQNTSLGGMLNYAANIDTRLLPLSTSLSDTILQMYQSNGSNGMNSGGVGSGALGSNLGPGLSQQNNGSNTGNGGDAIGNDTPTMNVGSDLTTRTSGLSGSASVNNSNYGQGKNVTPDYSSVPSNIPDQSPDKSGGGGGGGI